MALVASGCCHPVWVGGGSDSGGVGGSNGGGSSVSGSGSGGCGWMVGVGLVVKAMSCYCDMFG